jgi:hypothetical protein
VSVSNLIVHVCYSENGIKPVRTNAPGATVVDETGLRDHLPVNSLRSSSSASTNVIDSTVPPCSGTSGARRPAAAERSRFVSGVTWYKSE